MSCIATETVNCADCNSAKIWLHAERYGAVSLQHFQDYNFTAVKNFSSLIFLLQDRGYTVTVVTAYPWGCKGEKKWIYFLTQNLHSWCLHFICKVSHVLRTCILYVSVFPGLSIFTHTSDRNPSSTSSHSLTQSLTTA